MARSFIYTGTFEALVDYVSARGYRLERVLNRGIVQYHLGTTDVAIADEIVGAHPVSGDLMTLAQGTVMLLHRGEAGQRFYDPASLKLYRQLHRKFAKRR
jgi:hypothetical protein